jgi:hypothetical protein
MVLFGFALLPLLATSDRRFNIDWLENIFLQSDCRLLRELN